MNLSRSAQLFEYASGFLPGGVNSNSRFRAPHPLYFKKAQGPYMYDVDDNCWIDCIMGNGAIILGHDDREFKERMLQYMNTGIVTGVETELSIEAAKKFLSFVQTAEKVRFTNTGTEAIMHSLIMARLYTGKQHVAVIEGAYNGWYDAVNVSTWSNLSLAGDRQAPNSLPGSPGLLEDVVRNTLVLPFNDLQAAEQLLRQHKDRIAALVLEPVMIDIGYIPAKKAYLEGLRRLCDELNIVLIFDELLTGFRVSRGGAQEFFGVTPDLATFGKAIANGFMLAAVAGKTSLFDTVTPGRGAGSFVGTYNGHQVSLAAAMAFFEIFEERHVLATLQTRTEQMIAEFTHSAIKHGIPVQMQGRGGHFHWYFTDIAISDYRDATKSDKERYVRFYQALTEKGVYCSSNYLLHHAISMAHSDAVVETLLAYMDEVLPVLAGSGTK